MSGAMISIVIIQEITDEGLLIVPEYDTTITGHMRGTAIVAPNDIALTNINKFPSGREFAAEYKGLYIANIYIPSGRARRTEREKFYNADLPLLLQTGHGELIVRGEFNCVTDPTDTTGNFHASMALLEMIRGSILPIRERKTRPDPYKDTTLLRAPVELTIYISRGMTTRKTGIEILPATFTDHNAVVRRLALGKTGARRGRAMWKFDPTVLRDANLLTQLPQQWNIW
jgi:hypothetical protein